jgi:hemolysin activation/secretion protein
MKQKFQIILISTVFSILPGIARSQLPPTELPKKPPVAPIPEKPIDVPFQFEPKQPLKNDQIQLPQLKAGQFIFLDNTAISTKELQEIANPYVGKEINQFDIDTITNKITKLYTDKGFLTSGAVFLLEDNLELSTENATIKIRIIEDMLGSVRITEPNRLAEYTKKQISTDAPLNFNKLIEELRRQNANPLFKPNSFKARLLQNEEVVNRSILEISHVPAKSYDLSLFSNNYANSGVGTIRTGLEFTALNPLKKGDRLFLNYSNTVGSNVLFAEYSLPINKFLFTFSYAYGSNATVEEPFDVLDIEGTSQSYSLAARYSILDNFTDKGNDKLDVILRLTRREVEEKILDFPFPITQGSDSEGRTKTNSVQLGIDYQRIRADEAALIRAQFRVGFDLYSVTDPFFDNGEFFAAQLDAAYNHKLPFGLAFVARASAQVADRSLVSGEQLSLGGIYSIRGYRQDAFLVDTGGFGSIGLSIPIYKGPIGTFSLIPFFDIGGGNNYLSNQSALLAGAGLSLEYQFSDQLSASLSWGRPLFQLDNGRDPSTLQDNGIYFSVKGSLL